MKKFCNRGFTLIELLIVLTVLSILVSILAPKAPRAVKKARDSGVMLLLSNIRTAINSYYLVNNGKYPKSLKELIPKFIKQIPETWQGSNAKGKIGYNSQNGEVILLDETGSKCKIKDIRGIPYGEY